MESINISVYNVMRLKTHVLGNCSFSCFRGLGRKIIVSWCSLEEFLFAVNNISALKIWLLLSSINLRGE